MSFNSWQFLIFLPVVVILHWVLPKKYRWVMLLLASYLFYMSWNPWLIFLIVFTTGVSFMSGLLMEMYDSKKVRKACMIVTVVCCLGVLFFYKYFLFIVNSVIDIANLGGRNIAEFSIDIILPVGISFYTFQTLSYVIDVYRGRIKAERHLGYYALFVTYFPQLVAGPIERPENLLPQLKADRKLDSKDLCDGFRIALVGFFKKVVIADGVAAIVNGVYNNIGAATGLTVIVATVLFAIQIYCDFSGYTDIAVGVARMMGIKLCDNFNRPYLATSIRDFWRRWHISLTAWFTDYVYIPLGGNRCKAWRWAINVMIVFLLSGMWHGASWTFIVWGGIHGVYQIIGRLKSAGLKKLESKGKIRIVDNTATLMLRRVITFALVCFAWIFFRSNSLSDCGVAVAKIFTDWAGSRAALSALGFNVIYLVRVCLMCGVLALSYNMIKSDAAHNVKLSGGMLAARFVTYGFMLMAVAVAWVSVYVTGSGASAFIYFQF
ncbi:MAG: MBOAT family protein [Clostridiales bacterium]|nr:MBOAT family protein [Clostridiales bacterium]